jgi:hypothetical protein
MNSEITIKDCFTCPLRTIKDFKVTGLPPTEDLFQEVCSITTTNVSEFVKDFPVDCPFHKSAIILKK